MYITVVCFHSHSIWQDIWPEGKQIKRKMPKQKYWTHVFIIHLTINDCSGWFCKSPDLLDLASVDRNFPTDIKRFSFSPANFNITGITFQIHDYNSVNKNPFRAQIRKNKVSKYYVLVWPIVRGSLKTIYTCIFSFLGFLYLCKWNNR